MAYFGLQRPFLRQNAANADARSAPCDRCGVIRSLNQGLGPRSTGHSAPARGQLGGEVSQMQVTSSDIELVVGTLQWNVLFAAALCPPSLGLAPSPKRSLRGSGPKATEGGDFLEPLRIWDPHSRRYHGAWSRCNQIPDAVTTGVRASDQECRD